MFLKSLPHPIDTLLLMIHTYWFALFPKAFALQKYNPKKEQKLHLLML